MSDRADSVAPLKAPSILMGGLHLAALWALAILQPLLNLLGNNPDFFVARDNTAGQITLFVLLLAFLPPLVATGIEALINFLSSRARWIFHLGLWHRVFDLLAIGVPVGVDFALQLLRQRLEAIRRTLSK